MRNRAITFVLVFAFGVLVGAATVVSAQVDRASLQKTPAGTLTITTDSAGRVLTSTKAMPVSGPYSDVGLRVVEHRNGRVVGRLMARVNGQWVEVQLAPQDSYAGR